MSHIVTIALWLALVYGAGFVGTILGSCLSVFLFLPSSQMTYKYTREEFGQDMKDGLKTALVWPSMIVQLAYLVTQIATLLFTNRKAK